MLASSGSIFQLRTGSSSPLLSLNKSSNQPKPKLNAAPITRFNTRCSAAAAAKKSSSSVNVLDKKFLGTRLRASGSGRLHFWQSDGPGRTPKLRVGKVRSALSSVPEKPLGLYDPSFDKDSCGVGFVAELSGESSRKTVCMYVCMVCVHVYLHACVRYFDFVHVNLSYVICGRAGVRVCFVAEVGVGVFDWGLLDLWVGVGVCVLKTL